MSWSNSAMDDTTRRQPGQQGQPSRRRKRITKRLTRESHRDEEVKGLYLLPDGPAFSFDSFHMEGRPVRFITVGADPNAKIALTDEWLGDPGISWAHCILQHTERGWIVSDCNHTNHTLVNDVVVDSCKLHPGSVMTLGSTHLVAYGPGGFNGLVALVVFTLYSLVHRAFGFHGSFGRSADQVGVPKSTFVGWFKRKERPDRKSPKKKGKQ